MSNKFTESTVKEAVLEWADGLAYSVLHGPETVLGHAAERSGFDVEAIQELLYSCESICCEMNVSHRSSEQLAATRDKLLSRLLSGELQALPKGAET